MWAAVLIAALVVALGATPAQAKKKPKLSGFEATLPIVPAAPEVAAPATGSIFAAAGGYSPLYQGNRASRVGDPVTILLAETTTASKSVKSSNGKSGGASITPPTAGLLSFLNPNALNASSTSSFSGQGSAAQTSTLAATMSVTIAEVRPNGTALVRGEKKMLLSQGDEWIRFSGIVRLIDIDQDNTIASSRVADAKIEYSGKGALQRASTQGWLGRFFNLISPF
ncbi:flagellar basal body L-ring protein FlgH [Novosphingobium sp. 1949]|uniref:Flagellar L-ring protein n=1 Tax=Novosphingobium organovorum TaxID=2930092 RepID=A0ABT0BGZ6_9SPHN|nr:flagellar basal body L-ring protein FlgH [Novosphingobium organovorum]MCJ2184356.1 flagellar basal body L-ring protein FlgH [Novosphingobium organovorum]